MSAALAAFLQPNGSHRLGMLKDVLPFPLT